MRFFRRYHNFNLDDAEGALTLPKGWWAALTMLPTVKRVSLFFANYTRITPNQITVGAFALCLVAAYFFYRGSYLFLVAGALLFELNYLFDCVDGTVAKLRKQSTAAGAYIDFVLDQWRILFCLAALIFSHYRIHGNIAVFAVGFYYLFIKLVYVYNYNLRQALIARFGRWIIDSSLGHNGATNPISRWKNFAERKKLAHWPRSAESDTMVFFFGPVLNQVFWGMAIGSAFLTVLWLGSVLWLILKMSRDRTEEALRKRLSDEKIERMAVFGTGAAAENFISWCKTVNLEGKISYFIDNDSNKWGEQRFQRPVHKPEQLLQDRPDLIMVTSKNGRFDISEQLEQMGMRENEDFVYANFSR